MELNDLPKYWGHGLPPPSPAPPYLLYFGLLWTYLVGATQFSALLHYMPNWVKSCINSDFTPFFIRYWIIVYVLTKMFGNYPVKLSLFIKVKCDFTKVSNPLCFALCMQSRVKEVTHNNIFRQLAVAACSKGLVKFRLWNFQE